MPGTAIVTIGENQWNVEVATTTSELTTGLSGRASIAAGTGMLFVLPVRQVVIVQTNEMLFPIDIIFIKDNLVLDVASNISPGNLVEEATPCDGFLEINIGEADLVEVGDVVTTEITTPPPTGFDWSSITSFAIPLAVLGFVIGMLPKGSSEKEFRSGEHHSSPGIITIPKLPEEAIGDFLFYEYIRDLSKLRKKSLTEDEVRQLWEGWKEQRSVGHSIHGEPRRRLVEKYGSWAVGRAEAVCAENDIAAVEREAKRLSEVYRSRYSEEGMEYYTIVSPGQTVFHIGDVVSKIALQKENKRVRELGENEATYQ